MIVDCHHVACMCVDSKKKKKFFFFFFFFFEIGIFFFKLGKKSPY